jgi:hypothetical protein
MYRDDSRSLAAAAASYGVWIGELTIHIRDIMDGNRDVIYRHNVAHDGSMSRLLSVLQLDVMVWPGMGSEVVFELYKKEDIAATPTATTMVTATPTVIAPGCNHDNCLRQFIQESSAASQICPTYTAASATSIPSFASNCGGSPARVSSACSCIVTPTSTTSTSPPIATAPASASGYYIRVLWKGQVLRSSNPSLGVMDMLPIETLLAYFDGLVGVGASLVKGKCNA